MTITSVDILHCVSSMTEKVEIAKMSIILILKDESFPYYEGIKRVMYPECQVSPISPLSSPTHTLPSQGEQLSRRATQKTYLGSQVVWKDRSMPVVAPVEAL